MLIMGEYLRANTRIASYMAFPRFLIGLELSMTAKFVYMLLLDRSKLSRVNEGWTDELGRVFVHFTIESLSYQLGKSSSVIKAALKSLAEAGLIIRQRRGVGRPNRIYVLIPADQMQSPRQPDNNAHDRQNSGGHETEKPSGNNRNESDATSNFYGSYRNIRLTESDIEELSRTVPQWQQYMERLSCYMVSSGKSYQNHAATIRLWAAQDVPVSRSYHYQEGESL